jgi:hypothetical protein
MPELIKSVKYEKNLPKEGNPQVLQQHKNSWNRYGLSQ